MILLNQSDSFTRVCWFAAPGTCGVKGLCLHVTIKSTFRLTRDASLVPVDSDPEGPKGNTPDPEDESRGLYYPSDFSPCKERGEILVVGSAFPPASKQVRGFNAEFSAGPLKKSLRIHGPRQWELGILSARSKHLGAATPTRLSYANSFGGPNAPLNPIGVGRDGLTMHSIDLADQPVTSPNQNAMPAGFGPIPEGWATRSQFIGTYGKDYGKQSWPWWPPDFDPRYFQAAPFDQQLTGFWSGNEDLFFRNLHPEHPSLSTGLPGMAPYCFLQTRSPSAPARNSEDQSHTASILATNLETLWINPSQELAVLIWRGQAPISNVKFPELHALWVNVTSNPNAADFKTLAESQFLQINHAAQAAARPPSFSAGATDPELSGVPSNSRLVDELFQVIGELQSNVQKPQTELTPEDLKHVEEALKLAETNPPKTDFQSSEQLLEKLAELPDSVEPPPEDFPPPLDAVEDSSQRKAALDEQFAELKGANPSQPHWKDFFHEGHLDKDGFRAATVPGMDMRDAPLAGLDLSLTEFSGAIFTGNDLTGVNLSGCDLSGADFSDCQLVRTNFSGAILTNATFQGSDLKAANWEGALCEGTRFNNLDLNGIDWTNLRAPKASFTLCNLKHAILDHALLLGAEFPHSDLSRARLHLAILTDADLRRCRADHCDFFRSHLEGLRTDASSSFKYAQFVEVSAAGAIFEDCALDGANFTKADLKNARLVGVQCAGSTFSKCLMKSATCDDSHFGGTTFSHANAMQATFDRSTCTEADFSHANLFSASFWETNVTGAKWKESFLARSRFDSKNA